MIAVESILPQTIVSVHLISKFPFLAGELDVFFIDKMR